MSKKTSVSARTAEWGDKTSGIPQKWGIFDTILIVTILAVAVIFSAVSFASSDAESKRTELKITYTITARGLLNPTTTGTTQDTGTEIPDTEPGVESETIDPSEDEQNEDVPRSESLPIENKYWSIAPGTIVYTYSSADGDRGEQIGQVIECRAERTYPDSDDPAELMLIDLTLVVVSYGYYDDIYFHAVNEDGFDILIIGNDKISVCGEGFIFEEAVVANIKAEHTP